jgi:uncharacterized protein YprB with RNaseH-like and TPR domain
VDIETTGLDPRNEITTAVLYDGLTIRHYVNGENMDEFVRDVMEYRLLVTYNGKSFDIPFIQRYFGIHLSQAHIDLRHLYQALASEVVSRSVSSCWESPVQD